MTHYQIILLHHNPSLVYSVLDQFEQNIIDEQHKQYVNKEYNVIQSKRKLASFISLNSILNGDVSKVIVDFAPPPLVIMNSYFYGNGYKSDILLSFYDHFVDFNHYSLIDFASKNFKYYKFVKTCFIQLFDEKEIKLLTSYDNEMCEIYGFLTRLYCSAFERSHHIHLFAKNKRNGIQFEEKTDGNKASDLFIYNMKSMKSMNNNNNNNNNNNLISFSSIKILSHLLSTIINNNKVPKMMTNDLISKIRLRLNVVQEIKKYIDSSNQCVGDLVDHILHSKQKYQSSSNRRTSYI